MNSRRAKATWRILRRLAAGFFCLLVAVVLSGWLALRLSLARLDGRARLAGLSEAVAIERDNLGIPTVIAGNRLDVARATGFLHAQDRFFQMDLTRRAAAGELAELFGAAILDRDIRARRHRLRTVAEAAFSMANPGERAILEAYAEGVNAGLHALMVRPPEYLLLRQIPRSWRPEDCVLVLHAMGLQLSDDDGWREWALGAMRSALSPAAFDFFTSTATGWDATLDGSMRALPRIPTAAEFSAGLPSTNDQASIRRDDAETIPGSNAWTVDGHRTGTGAGLLANDMHLGLSLPNTWYRMQFHWRDERGQPWRVAGATLPGTPAMVVGGNGRVAWGFTAAQLDVADLVELEINPNATDTYRVGSQWKTIQKHSETVRVAGQSATMIEVPWTIWGPVVKRPELDKPYAIRWAMQLPEAANMKMLAWETALSAVDVLDRAPECGLPWLNVHVADRDGNVGWTLGGRFPRRVGFDGRTPASWADGQRRWDGFVPASEIPRVYNPVQGVVWSANQRVMGCADYARLEGSDSLDPGARAAQIRDALLVLSHATPARMLEIQLDDRALFLARWQRLLRDTLAHATNEASAVEALPLVEGWGGRAAVDSAGYRLVRAFRFQTTDRILDPVVAHCRARVKEFGGWPTQPEGVVWEILQRRPSHLLARRFSSYDELLLDAWRGAVKSLPPPARPLRERTWGDRNRVRVQHPFSHAMPRLSRWLDIPPQSLPGDDHMPRAQSPGAGASQRMAVSPGRETEGYFHMPGGQSGHFLSPYYRAGHKAWAEGKATPFLPGPPQHNLTLSP